MDLRLHIGVHRTATTHLRSVLAHNQSLLEEEGIYMPPAPVVERAFAKAMKSVTEGGDIDEINAMLITSLTEGGDYRRIVMIDPNISGNILRPIGKEFFYPRISSTVSRIFSTLDGLPVRIFVGVRNPATFIPSCYGAGIKVASDVTFESFISGANLPRLRWSDFLHRAQLKNQEMGMTVWRHEDYAFMWRDIAQAITGVSNRELLEPVDLRPRAGLSLRGAILLQQYLTEHPMQERHQYDRIYARFERKFPASMGYHDDVLWPEDLRVGMTENYDDDWYYIERMENVQALNPRHYV